MPDLIEALADDHTRLGDLVDRIEEIGKGGDADERARAVSEVLDELTAQTTAMREVAVEASIHSLPDGPEMAAEQGELLDELDEAAATLRGLSSEDGGYEEHLRQLVERVRETTGAWSETVRPALAETLSPEHREALGEAYERSKEGARATR